MTTSRFFVTNLPTDTSDEDLHKIFEKYGKITLVELKTKENALEPGNINVFAFVTLQISAADAEYYLNELKWQKLRGAKLKISLAKESFLERLKRERAENEAAGTTNGQENHGDDQSGFDVIKNDFLPENLQNTRRVFSLDEDIDDDEISADLLITKKRAARSVQNGKIVIEESGAKPLHVIEKTKKFKSANKTNTAEQKRKESLHKMKDQYDQKKNAIQAALAGTNGCAAKKIKFSDAEDDEVEASISKTQAKLDIFDADEEEDVQGDEDLNDLKIEYGKKGEKLAKLQSEQQNVDARFRLDAKFVDDDDGNETNVNEENAAGEDEDDERKWQLNILEQVVGYKLNTETAAQKAAKTKKMTRFDPSKAEHEKLLRQTTEGDDAAADNLKKRKKKSKNENSPEDLESVSRENEVPATVSKEVFYVVSDTLSEALKTRGEGFSLLNMFGAQNELEQREDQLNQLKEERILIKKQNKINAAATNYDFSSSGEDNEDDIVDNEKSNLTQNEDNKIKKNSVNKLKTTKHSKVILSELFFFATTDERLKEGTGFFHYDKANQIPEEEYEPVRQRLNKLIKKKIIKTKKNHIGAGRKMKRNNKKF